MLSVAYNFEHVTM